MTLSHSRHQYATFVFDQSVATWLRCHREAFEFFGGVPKRIVYENVPRNIFVLLLPPALCARARSASDAIPVGGLVPSLRAT